MVCVRVTFHENDGNHENAENDTDIYKQGVECWIRGNHGNHKNNENHGANRGFPKPRVPQATGLEIPDNLSPMPYSSFPCFFGDFLAFFHLQGNPCFFWAFFPSFPGILGVLSSGKILVFFMVFLAHLEKWSKVVAPSGAPPEEPYDYRETVLPVLHPHFCLSQA